MHFIRQTFILYFLIGCHGIIQTRSKHNFHPPIHLKAVSLTQKGYIQFLKYPVHVPPIKDYTFCIWVRSNNFTYAHPVLSYSKHEKERLIRVWISSFGKELNLAILEHRLFRIPVHFVENRWYHICQSWSSHQASWSLFLDGKLKASGFEFKLKNTRIKGGGDIVVGQEYTDFDRGLDDGIEGDVFGFNFVLAPTLPPRKPFDEIPSLILRKPKGILDMFLSFDFHDHTRSRRPYSPNFNRKIINDNNNDYNKPLGLTLVELSYNCVLGKGAPLKGKEVVISWTKSPVRVFGGAILKNVLPFCT